MRPARFCQIAALICAGLGLAGCSSIFGGYPHDSSEGFSVAKYGAAAPRLVSYGQSVPKGGGTYLVGQPYRIAGKTYIPTQDPPKSQVGYASWYGFDFHGRQTANGEIYDLDGVTAASPTMPLPSYARITNLENGRAITVRVNDRGPFVDDRIVDVSRTVAQMLDFEDEGTAKVKVDYIGPAPLDGDDSKQLLASYSGPGTTPPTASGAPVQVASAQPAVSPRVPAPVSVAPASPAPVQPAPVQLASVPVPHPAPAVASSDPIAPLISSSGLASSADATLSPAEQAADLLARPDLKAELAMAAQKRAAQMGLRGGLSQ